MIKVDELGTIRTLKQRLEEVQDSAPVHSPSFYIGAFATIGRLVDCGLEEPILLALASEIMEQLGEIQQRVEELENEALNSIPKGTVQ